MKRLGVFLLPLDGMPVHRITPQQFVRFPQQITGTHLYSWVERGTVRVKCLAQEHNTMSPARARTQTTRSVDERNNHEATAPPTHCNKWLNKTFFCLKLVVLVKLTFSSFCLSRRLCLNGIRESHGAKLSLRFFSRQS